jgi:hypothetical protein
VPDKVLSGETLDFIFDYTKEGPERQLGDVDALDSKMVQVFSAASVIIGLGGLSGHSGGVAGAILIALAVVAYVVVGLAAVKHLGVRTFRRSLQADVIWRKLWRYGVSDVKHSIVDDISRAYAHNKEVIDGKARTLQIALIAVAVEVFFVGCGLVASRLVV